MRSRGRVERFCYETKSHDINLLTDSPRREHARREPPCGCCPAFSAACIACC